MKCDLYKQNCTIRSITKYALKFFLITFLKIQKKKLWKVKFSLIYNLGHKELNLHLWNTLICLDFQNSCSTVFRINIYFIYSYQNVHETHIRYIYGGINSRVILIVSMKIEIEINCRQQPFFPTHTLIH